MIFVVPDLRDSFGAFGIGHQKSETRLRRQKITCTKLW